MEVFILKCNNTDIIVRLYGECTDLMIVDSECIGIMKGKVESTAVAMKWPLSSQLFCCWECHCPMPQQLHFKICVLAEATGPMELDRDMSGLFLGDVGLL